MEDLESHIDNNNETLNIFGKYNSNKSVLFPCKIISQGYYNGRK